MKYLDVYEHCKGCPVMQWCGTAISSSRLCNSYGQPQIPVNYGVANS